MPKYLVLHRTILLTVFLATERVLSAPAQIDLGQVQLSSIDHIFDTHGLPIPTTPPIVRDTLIVLGENSGAGSVLPSISANLDLNNQLVLTIFAPPGQRFVVQPPPGLPIRDGVHLGGGIDWRAAPSGRRGSAGP